MPKHMKEVRQGCLVAMNDLKDATWFEVVKVDGFELTVKQFDEEVDFALQYIDKSLVKQVRYSA